MCCLCITHRSTTPVIVAGKKAATKQNKTNNESAAVHFICTHTLFARTSPNRIVIETFSSLTQLHRIGCRCTTSCMQALACPVHMHVHTIQTLDTSRVRASLQPVGDDSCFKKASITRRFPTKYGLVVVGVSRTCRMCSMASSVEKVHVSKDTII